MQELLAVLPTPSSPEGEEEPSEYTICGILGTLQVVTHSSYDNCKYVCFQFDMNVCSDS